jgi:hypothetical protein
MNRTIRLTLWAVTLLSLPITVYTLFSLFGPRHGWFDYQNYLIGHDFVNFWFGPHLAWQGRLDEIYDRHLYYNALKMEIAPLSPVMNFSYPPTLLMLVMPLGLLPWGASYIAWFFIGTTAFIYAALGGIKAPVDRELALMLVFSQAFLAAASIGQLTMVLSLLLVAGLRFLPNKPALAEFLFGVLTIKPQLGLLLPIILLMQREWLAIIVASINAVSLILLSLLAFGPEPWLDFIRQTLPYQSQVISQPTGFVWNGMVSFYAFFYKIGYDVSSALKLHVATAIIIAAFTIYTSWQSLPWPLMIAIIALGSILVTPYVVYYDLGIAAAGLIWYLKSQTEPIKLLFLIAIAMFWALPVILIILDLMGITLIAPVMLAVFAGLVWEALRGHHPAA